MRRREAILMLFGFGAVFVLVLTAVGTVAQECQPGEFVYNESGAIVCIPNVEVNETPFFNFHANLSSDGSSVSVYVVVTDPRGAGIQLILLDSNATQLYSDSVDLYAGEYYSWYIKLPSQYDVVFIKFVADGYEFGPYPVAKPEVSPVISYSSLDPRVAVIVILAGIAPVLGVVLRPSAREIGVALVALSFLYIPVMYAFGFSFPIPEVVVAVLFISGILVVMSSRD